MKLGKRILLAGTALLLCLNLLTGCSWVSLGVLYGMLEEDRPSQPMDTQSGVWEDWMNSATGSATYPESGTVLISVYLDTGLDWTEEDVALTK